MASQTGPSALPPTTILKSETISQSDAHEFLTAYLDRAVADPGLQPDATLSAQGPVSANVGSTPNLVIHNLKRVQAGLAGEVLGKDLTFAKLDDGEDGVFKLHSHNLTDGENWTGGKKSAKGEDATSGWQDLESFKREQVDLVEGEDEDDEEGGAVVKKGPTDAMDVDDAGNMPQQLSKADKEERKRQKKERRKAEQKARAVKGQEDAGH